MTAFLNPKIGREEVFLSLPLGMSWVDPEMQNRGVRTVRLKKALYGLQQDPKLWFDEINGFLIHLGFTASPADPNLYTKGSVIVLLYVDDILIIDTQSNSIQGNIIKDLLCAKYKMSNLGIARRSLRIEIESSANGISLCQTGYINTTLKRFGLEAAHDAKSPMDPNVRLDNTSCEDKQVDKNLYLSIVGSLMYAALATRPDISFCVTTLSRYNSTRLQMHLTAAKRVLRYLKHTKHHRSHYLRTQTGPLTGFTDSDWAGRTATRKSVGGCIFFGSEFTSCMPMRSGPIHWQVQTQSVVALSTLEAEYIACSDATTEALWLRQLEATILTAIDRNTTPRTVPIGADNQGALKLIKSGVIKQKTRHIAVKFHHSHDEEQMGTVKFNYVHTTDNVADLLTKALPLPHHQTLTYSIGLRNGRKEEEGVLEIVEV